MTNEGIRVLGGREVAQAREHHQLRPWNPRCQNTRQVRRRQDVLLTHHYQRRNADLSQRCPDIKLAYTVHQLAKGVPRLGRGIVSSPAGESLGKTGLAQGVRTKHPGSQGQRVVITFHVALHHLARV